MDDAMIDIPKIFRSGYSECRSGLGIVQAYASQSLGTTIFGPAFDLQSSPHAILAYCSSSTKSQLLSALRCSIVHSTQTAFP